MQATSCYACGFTEPLESKILDRTYSVGDWRVDPLGNTLSRGGKTVRVEPKAIWVLTTLAGRAGEIVTRQDLYEEVWRGRPVTDEVLSRCVSLLRSTLGDDPRQPVYIQTIPRVGYKLLASVRTPGNEVRLEEAPAPSETGPVNASEKAPPVGRMRGVIRAAAVSAVAGYWIVRGSAVLLQDSGAAAWALRTIALLAVAGSLVVVALAWSGASTLRPATRAARVWHNIARFDYALMAAVILTVILALQSPFMRQPAEVSAGPARDGGSDAIAVLPFRNLSVGPGTDYFSDGLTDELVSNLTRVSGLRVIARASSFAMKNHQGDVRTIGKTLGVSRLVSGTVRIDGRNVRISVQLVNTEDGTELWSQSFDTTIDAIFEVQNQIASSVVATMAPLLELPEPAAVAAAGPLTSNSEAYLLYLRARHMLKRRDKAPVRQALVLLDQALTLDPTYTDAYLEQARAFMLLPYYSGENQEAMFARAREAIARGAEHGAATVNNADGLIAFMAFRSWKWKEAEQRFRNAIAADPNDANIYQWYSQLQASLGHAERSLELAAHAKQLDALSPVVYDRLAVAYLWTNRDESAQRQFEEASLLGLGPTANPRAYLVLLFRQRRFAEAEKLLSELQQGHGAPVAWVTSFVAALQGTGTYSTAVEMLATTVENGNIEPRFLFGAWIYLRENDRAMAVAHNLLADRAKFDVEFLFSREATEFRQHPQFGDLVGAIGLDDHWNAYGWPAVCRRSQQQIRCDL